MRDCDAVLTLEGIRHDAIAITGISCRFPGADGPRQFWNNLVGGVESVTRWRTGHDSSDPVAARAMLADVDKFDARFFRFTPKQADIADPQLRLALEHAWLALESANCGNADPTRLVGVFMGASLSTYLLGNIVPNYAALSEDVGGSQILFTNDKDFYPTTISHRLDLKGPSLNVSTACSTGLVAVHSACQALITYQCDIALAGASSVLLPQDAPRYEAGGIYSKDGHCRAFDAEAGGTVGGSGCGFVVLKRIEDALRDSDFIHAVILGGAVNNDGGHKVSFAAPSASGQRAVIEQALANADVHASSISLVEGHGTGTLLGDAVEIEALTGVFDGAGIAPGSCALGSVKTNIGHLDTAAGMAGLIKAALALAHGTIPPSLHFHRPNPQGALEGGPFYVPTTATAWQDGARKRRAGVSAFGIGGTNVHLVLQQAPPPQSSPSGRPFHVVTVSAPSAAGCASNAAQLGAYLRDTADIAIADVAFTLGVGRKTFDHRQAYVARDRRHLLDLLEARGDVASAPRMTAADTRVVFVFPAIGAADFPILKAAYACEATFRLAVAACADAARARFGDRIADIRDAFVRDALPDDVPLRAAVMFAGHYAMARLWMHWGVHPQAVAGHGTGAWVAACLAGVLSVDDAIGSLVDTHAPEPMRNANPTIALLTPFGSDADSDIQAAILAPTTPSVTESDPRYCALAFAAHDAAVGGNGWGARLCAWQRADDVALDAQALYTGLATVWMDGLTVDWAVFYADETRRKLPIPTMPFERSRHWLDPPAATGAPRADAKASVTEETSDSNDPVSDIADWCYVPAWKRCLEPPAVPLAETPKRWLLLTREDRFCAEFASRLRRRGHEVVEVFADTGFESVAATRLRMDPERRGDYDALLAKLSDDGMLPDCIVHLWSLADAQDGEPLSEHLHDGLGMGLHALLFLAQALGKADITRRIRVTSVYAGVHDVCGDRALQPHKSMLTAALKIIPQEYPNLSCLGLDVEPPDAGSIVGERLIDRLIAECESEPTEVIGAYRGDARWVQTFEPVHLQAPQSDRPRLKQGGVYLITGGCGGVGMALAGYLARNVRCNIALLGRSLFPPSDDWPSLASGADGTDPEQARLAREILALQALDCRVKLYRADVADRDALARSVAEIERDFGAICGVIHAAGVADTAGIIQNRSRETTERALSAKVHGAVHLDELLRGRDLDFFVLCSSVGSVLHALKFGEVGYVAANDFLDAFASYRHAYERGLTVSINWTDWLDAGMSARAKARFSVRQADFGQAPSADPPHPLLGRRRPTDTAGECVFENVLRAQDSWVLDGHRIAGTAVLPGTAYIELAFAAFAACTGSQDAEIRDLTLTSPLVVPDGDACELRVVLKKLPHDGFSLAIEARNATRREAWALHARAEIAALDDPVGDQAMSARFDDMPTVDPHAPGRGDSDESNTGMRFGGRWQAFDGIVFADGCGTASLRLPERYRDDLDRYLLHPALLDCALSFLIPALLEPGTEPYVPLHYRTVRIHRRGCFPDTLTAYARSEQAAVRDGGAITLDARLVDASGAVWMDVVGMTARKNALGPAAPSAARDEAPPNHLLEIGTVGRLDTLRFVPMNLPSLRPGDVEVEIHAAALNFKDVLVALGMVPPPTGATGKFGLEFAGVVTRLGSDVRNLDVGDEVMGFGGSWVAPRAIYPAAWLRHRPARLSVAQAATAPVAFTIAQLALRETGGLRRGESVIIHSATGGVGMAAVQVAQLAGAEIHATAGSDAKRAFLRGLGVEHVYDSRSNAFAREILERTGGGVDVVLNSLGAQLARASLDVLRPQGRFLELGLGNDDLAPVAQAQGKHFLPIVVDTADPGLERAWTETVKRLSDGSWAALPTKSFGIEQVVDAFEYMAAARHVGKLVVTYDGWERLALAEASNATGVPEGDFFHGLLRGMSSRDGTDVFDRILHRDFPRIVVSTQPLQPLIERSRVAGRLGVGAFLSGENLLVAARSRPDLTTRLQAPDSDTQSKLVRIWKDLLGLRDVGIHDDFFDLGGDSLSAIRLLSRCREEFQVDQTLASLLDHPTVAQLAERIEQLRVATEPSHGDDAKNETLVI